MMYGFENIRVMTYTRIRNMASLVRASAYFATAWIDRNIKREALAEHLAHLGKRLGEVPEFAAYAIADGIRRAAEYAAPLQSFNGFGNALAADGKKQTTEFNDAISCPSPSTSFQACHWARCRRSIFRRHGE